MAPMAPMGPYGPYGRYGPKVRGGGRKNIHIWCISPLWPLWPLWAPMGPTAAMGQKCAGGGAEKIYTSGVFLPYGPYGPYGPLWALRPLWAKSARGGERKNIHIWCISPLWPLWPLWAPMGPTAAMGQKCAGGGEKIYTSGVFLPYGPYGPYGPLWALRPLWAKSA